LLPRKSPARYPPGLPCVNDEAMCDLLLPAPAQEHASDPLCWQLTNDMQKEAR